MSLYISIDAFIFSKTENNYITGFSGIFSDIKTIKTAALANTTFNFHQNIHTTVLTFCYYLGLGATKPVFGVTNKARLKPVSSVTETSSKTENLLEASLDMILSNKRKTKVLIRLHKCAG